MNRLKLLCKYMLTKNYCNAMELCQRKLNDGPGLNHDINFRHTIHSIENDFNFSTVKNDNLFVLSNRNYCEIDV